jgi:hypothetical protein
MPSPPPRTNEPARTNSTRCWPTISLLLLSLALTSCCKRGGVLPVQKPLHPCLTEALLASRPRQPDATNLSTHSLAMLDLLAHAVLVRDAYIDRLIVNCRSAP